MAHAQRIARPNGSTNGASHDHPRAHPTHGTQGRTHRAQSGEVRTLDDLSSRTIDELAELYAQGRSPQLGVLAGPMRGRLLAAPPIAELPVVGGAAHAVFRWIAARPWMPWKGKTFAPPDAPHHAGGRNRVFGFEALPFDAHAEKSALDKLETLVLRYARSENPPFVRVLVDELREIGRGLWLGPAYVRGPNGPIVLLWWAVVKE